MKIEGSRKGHRRSKKGILRSRQQKSKVENRIQKNQKKFLLFTDELIEIAV